MPELPEIETIRRSLEDVLEDVRITSVRVELPKQVATHDPCEFAGRLEGKRFVSFDRRGKYLVLGLEGGSRLVVHLRMTGQLLYTDADEPADKHVHVVFGLEGGHELRYRDVRQFGRLYLLEDSPFAEQEAAPKGLKNLGREPLDPDWSEAAFCEELRSHRSMLKSLLLRQDVVCGLGNIYVDEALFRAGLHPERAADTLSASECRRLYHAVRDVLEEAIDYRGTTFSDFRDGRGETGGFRERLKAYGRGGEPCPRCGTELQKTRVAGRGTHYCPRCQCPDGGSSGS